MVEVSLTFAARWLREEFETADKTHTGLIDEAEVVHLVKKLNTGLTTVKIQQKLKVIVLLFRFPGCQSYRGSSDPIVRSVSSSRFQEYLGEAVTMIFLFLVFISDL